MSRPRYRRFGKDEGPRDEDAAAVVLPHVVVQVNGDGTLTVSVDGVPFEPGEFAPAWRRSTFGTLIDAVTEDRRAPVRVEVHEADGSTFTDIIAPGKRRRPEPAPKVESQEKPSAGVELVEVTGDGFVPGEDVAVAIIVSYTDATPTGVARVLLDAAQLDAWATAEVVLLGWVSGTQVIARPR